MPFRVRPRYRKSLRNRIDLHFEKRLAMPFALVVATLRLVLHHLDFLT